MSELRQEIVVTRHLCTLLFNLQEDFCHTFDMDSQLPTIDEANSHVLNSVDSVNGQETVADIDIESIKSEIVSILIHFRT